MTHSIDNTVLFSRLETENFTSCLVALTESEILWKRGVSVSLGEVNRIDLKEIVCVISITQLCHETLPAKMFKVLRTKMMELLQTSKSGFIVSSIVRCGSHKWRTQEHLFWCDSLETINLWISTLNERIRLASPLRPKRLLIMTNPTSGYKKAEHIHDSMLRPIFNLANIKTDTFVSNYRGHFKEHLLTCPLDGYDGIVCVGGDGSFAEIVQGLLLRERLQAKLPLFHGHFPESPQIASCIRVGIIPAGSTDTVVFSTHGTNDSLTAVLHIILGDDLAMDVAALHSLDDGSFIRYAVSMVGYGFHADLLRNDDKLRWLGPRRYDYSGFMAFLQHSVYRGELTYLPSADRNSHVRDGVICAAGCSVCARYQPEMNKLSPATDSGVDISDDGVGIRLLIRGYRLKSKAETSSAPLPEDELPETSLNIDLHEINAPPVERCWSLFNGSNLCQSNAARQTKIKPVSTATLPIQNNPSWAVQGCSKGWKTVRGTFVAVNAFLLSCRCTRSMNGPSPSAHFGDGCIDLILIRECSRARFFQFLTRMANTSATMFDSNKQACSPFELPFVQVERVCAFKFREETKSRMRPSASPGSDALSLNEDHDNNDSIFPWSEDVSKSLRCHASLKLHRNSPKRSVWCADGEIVHYANVSVYVHRQLLRIFARGPEALSDDVLAADPKLEARDCNKLFDAIVANAPTCSKSVHSIPITKILNTNPSTVVIVSPVP